MEKILFLLLILSSILSCNKKTGADYIKSGLSKAKIEDYKGAIAYYDTAIMLSPESAKAYWLRGNAKVNLELFITAIADYDTAIVLDSNNAKVYYWRGNAKATLAILKSNLLSFSPNKLEGLSKDAIMASIDAVVYDSIEVKASYVAAIADFNKSIELNSDDANTYYYRGLAKKYLQDYRGAIEDFNKAIVINPKYIDAYYSRGNAKIALGQNENGCLDFSKAGELGMEEAYKAIKEYCN